uniref:EF-hand domain-containing protein n=1 Tax=Hanusia phi TaxID=3032 RepID=A0A6T7RS55_9CRYP|mmetsp:Transcript_31182/g.70170  ORF Transcript_31182/g.70170 Transcript_31182/m.70170 type:complete len:189 (+) Transcript_31182:476-1042(+)
MGAGASSSLLTEKQVQKYVKETGFSPPELEFLFRRFRFLCKNSNTLGANDLSSNPNLAANPYVKRIFAVMPKDGYGQVTFDTFVKTAAIFRPGKPVVEKLKFIFDLFDYNLDDTLDVSELHQILSLVRPDMSVEEREALIKTTVSEIVQKGGDPTKDGQIHGRNFVSFAKNIPNIDEILTLDLASHLV